MKHGRANSRLDRGRAEIAEPTTTTREVQPPVLSIPDDPRSLWLRTAPAPEFPRLDGDVHVDVAIVGGGITGLTAATLLKANGLTVAVAEARRVATGESGNTTAHLTECTDGRVHPLVRHFGKDGARSVWHAGRAAIHLIEDLVARHDIACGFRFVPGYLYTERQEGVAELEEEYAATRELGIEVKLVREDVPLPYRVAAALRYEGQARFHVRKYLIPLAQVIPGEGSHLFEETRALEVRQDPPRVVTEFGVIHARDVIVATNAPVNNLVFLQTKMAHYRSYAIGARMRGPAPDGLFWDDEEPYHYVRSHSMDGETVLIVGGEDHRTGQEDDTRQRFERLAAWAAERFPLQAIDYRWSGQIIEPVDGLPYIGRNSLSEHVWEATGFSGTGMTFGTVAAILLRDLILGRDNPWRELFSATRVTPIASAAAYVKENAAFPVHFVRDRLTHSSTDVGALGRGEGGILHPPGAKGRVAVFRDEAGRLHCLSPICSHLRCIGEFNRAEKTWDCPCHGSRFDVEGRVLNGPATHGLEKVPAPPG